MHARKAITLLLIVIAFLAGLAVSRFWPFTPVSEREGHAYKQEPVESGAKATWYTCGMHPEVVQDQPGECPKCGMKLQPMSDDRATAMGLTEGGGSDKAQVPGDRKIAYWRSPMVAGEIHDSPGKDSMGHDLAPVYSDEISAGSIRIDPVTEQNMGVRIDEVVRGPLTKTVRTVGIVDYDETTLATVNTKVSGWVEKLYVDQTGAQVHRGEPLFEFYSPELFSAQQEYLAALRNIPQGDSALIPRSRLDASSLVRDARRRLEYFDISPEQIAELQKTRKVRKTLTIAAPFTGIVTHKSVVEGERVMAGQDVFRIADLSSVWVIGKVYEYDLPYIRLGQEAFMTLTYLPGTTFHGRVTYVYPYLEEKTREIRVRMEFHNPGYELKPGMYATITMTRKIAQDAVLVPDLAVIRTGERAVAFVVSGPGRFEPRELKLGVRSEGNRLQVLSGLAPGEHVVVSGQFLLDSESRLREAALKFLEPGKVDGASPIKATTHDHDETTEKASALSEGELQYVCPMPEHVDILYDRPGKCPLCGMELIPVRRRAGHVEGPAISHWTCPMPEHANVKTSGPGKCPICGMSLIPFTDEDAATTTPEAAAEGQHEHSH